MTNIETIKAKLLRKIGQNGDFTYPRNPDGPEAVAVIDALVADNERLRLHLDVALEVLAEEGVCGDECISCKEARAALKDATRD